MPSKNYKDIAREKLETQGPRTPGKRVSRMAQEAEMTPVSTGKSHLGYAIFVLCCISAGVITAVVINENQEPEPTGAPFIDDDNLPAPFADGSTNQDLVNQPSSGVQTGDNVEMAYKLWIDDDKDGQVDTNEEPYQDSTFTTEVSSSKLIYGFYKNVLGMQEGEEKTFTVPPEEAYSSGELAGMTLVFYVKILDIK